MAEPIVVQCPSCLQKYKLSGDKIGRRAKCRCGQSFTIATTQPIDEDTIFGWVVENADPSSKSVLGGTGIIDAPRPKRPLATTAASPGQQIVNVMQNGVRLDHLDESGAHFEFPASELVHGQLRESFPKQCISCSCSRDLVVYVVVWADKLRSDDQWRYQDQQFRLIGKLKDLVSHETPNWQDDLPLTAGLPKPYNLPLTFYGCDHCTIETELTTSIFKAQGVEYCQLRITNLDVAAKFYRNNNGESREYDKLVQALKKQKADRWQALPSSVRRQIQQWHKQHSDERFKGFFPDTDFGRSEVGKAGLVLTDKRLCFHKYTTVREYTVKAGGKLLLQPEDKITNVRIVQKGKKDAILHLDPRYAEKLVNALRHVSRSWKVTGDIRSW